jgi:putative oxidoreductase
MKQDILLMSLAKRWLILGARLVLGGLFLYTGLSKIGQPYQFAAAIQAYQLLPEFLVALVAVFIPWIETVSAIALLWGRKPRSALLIFLMLLTLFVVIIVSALSKGLDIDCGCGLFNNRRVGWLVLMEDVALILVTTWLYSSLLPRFATAPEASKG